MSRHASLAPHVVISVCLLLSMVACGGGSNGSSNDNGNNQGGASDPAPTVAITISPTSATVAAAGTQQFQATVTGTTNTAVQWEVNNVAGGNSQYGTISSAGLYTAPSPTVPLQVTVTAVSNADSTKTANAAVTVNSISTPPAITVAISPTTVTMAVSATQQFTATVTGTNNPAVTWSVDGVSGGNTTVGTISTSGLYTAPSTVGSHTVTATSVADTTKNASSAVTVIGLTVSPQSTSLTPLGTRQFTATVQGTSNNAVTWSVDGVAGGNTRVGTISTGGLYTAPADTGSHTVTATSVALPTYSVNASVSVMNAPNGTVSVLTFHNDDVRDGANLNETTLNTTNVNSQQFGNCLRSRWTRKSMLSRFTCRT